MGGELVTRVKDSGARLAGFPPTWSREVVKTTGDKGARAFVVEPVAGEGEVKLGDLYVRGTFRVVK